VDKAVICQLELDEAKVKQFKDAIENSYWFEFFIGMFWAVFFRCVVCVDESVVVHMFIRYQFVKASVYLMFKIPLLCLCFLPSVSLYHAAWVCACGVFFGGLHDLLNYILELSFLCILGCSLFTFLSFCFWFVIFGILIASSDDLPLWGMYSLNLHCCTFLSIWLGNLFLNISLFIF